MIIRKKTQQSKKQDSISSQTKVQKGNVIKREDVILNAENARNTNQNKEIIVPKKVEKPQIREEENFEKIDISSIEFKERVERRRGDRRRGYRRIDERSLVTRAQQEAHSIKELAAREGYQNGLRKAHKEIEDVKNSLCEFVNLKDEMYDNFLPHIMEISMEVAKKIIKKEVDLSQDILKNIIMSVLDEINSDAQRVEIKVNSQDYEFAQSVLPEIIEAKNLSAKLIIGQDDTIQIGSCVVVANNGVIDANFKTQLAVLQNAFGIYRGGI